MGLAAQLIKYLLGLPGVDPKKQRVEALKRPRGALLLKIIQAIVTGVGVLFGLPRVGS